MTKKQVEIHPAMEQLDKSINEVYESWLTAGLRANEIQKTLKGAGSGKAFNVHELLSKLVSLSFYLDKKIAHIVFCTAYLADLEYNRDNLLRVMDEVVDSIEKYNPNADRYQKDAFIEAIKELKGMLEKTKSYKDRLNSVGH